MAAIKKNEEVENVNPDLDNVFSQLHRLIELSLSLEMRAEIKGEFEDIACAPARQVIESISKANDVPRAKRLAALTMIYEAVSEAMDEIAAPEMATVFWEHRGKENRFMSPFDFVVEHYPSFHDGSLTLNMIASHDEPLYAALHAKRKKGEWPESFSLPTQSEANDRALEAIGGNAPKLTEIAEQSPLPVRELLRLYEVGKSRSRKRKSTGVK
jgi:hypothetical protein